MAARSHLSRGFLPPDGLFGGSRTVRFKLLKGQCNVVGVGRMALLSPDRGCRPPGFPILYGLHPTDLPAVRLQLGHDCFPILRHLQIEAELNKGMQLPK